MGGVSTATGDYSFAVGYDSDATAGYAIAQGRYALANKFGQYSHTSGRFSSTGDAQYSRMVSCNNTTDATQTELLLGKVAATRMVLPASTTWVFQIFIVARQTGGAAGTLLRVRHWRRHLTRGHLAHL